MSESGEKTLMETYASAGSEFRDIDETLVTRGSAAGAPRP